jgi:hypothetical protein
VLAADCHLQRQPSDLVRTKWAFFVLLAVAAICSGTSTVDFCFTWMEGLSALLVTVINYGSCQIIHDHESKTTL